MPGVVRVTAVLTSLALVSQSLWPIAASAAEPDAAFSLEEGPSLWIPIPPPRALPEDFEWEPAQKPPTATKKTPPEIAQIPQTPSAPPSLKRKNPWNTFQCRRQFLYRGKKLECDSNLHQDGEQLRPILGQVPEAIAHLNTYQNNRRQLKTLAYVGSFGLLLAAIGWLGGMIIRDNVKIPGENPGPAFRNAFLIPAVAITGGAMIYGYTQLRTNERHLGNAVSTYNLARPEDPIELQFSTGISF